MESKTLRPYKKALTYSYVPGAFAVFELLSARPGDALSVYARPSFTDDKKLRVACDEYNVPYYVSDKAFAKTGQKDNCYVFAVFNKYTCALKKDTPHLCLVSPSDMGNLGSITRSMAAFGVFDLAIIGGGADIFDPKAIRASMGAVFKINVQFFRDFSKYRESFPEHACFPFMTDGGVLLEKGANLDAGARCALIFGNEAEGLPPSFKDYGTSVKIPQTNHVDSLNLSVAVGVGLYWFFSL